MEELQKQIKSLRAFVAVLAIIVVILAGVTLFQFNRSGNFKEINAQRVNIVEKDGTLRMAISNRELQDPGAIGGKKIAKRDRPAGMIFFNDDGDECGGLVYDGDKKSASMTYSIDQYKNDQIMQLQYAQSNGDSKLERSYGLKIWDRADRFPLSDLVNYADSLKKLNDTNALKAGFDKIRKAGWFGKERLFVGKNPDGDVGIFMRDSNGKPRLRIYVNKQNQPVIESLDENGVVVAAK